MDVEIGNWIEVRMHYVEAPNWLASDSAPPEVREMWLPAEVVDTMADRFVAQVTDPESGKPLLMQLTTRDDDAWRRMR